MNYSDLYKLSVTELQNLKAREETHTDQDVIVVTYLNNRIKQIDMKKTK